MTSALWVEGVEWNGKARLQRCLDLGPVRIQFLGTLSPGVGDGVGGGMRDGRPEGERGWVAGPGR